MANMRHVITAAHCLPSQSGNLGITIQSSSGCAYPNWATDCTVQPGGATFYNRNLGWPGGENALNDIGFIRLGHDPLPPLNNSANWMRLSRTSATVNQQVWLVGWGVNQQNFSGGGVERLSNQDIGIDWVHSSTSYFLYNAVSGEGRQCSGDSGGPTIATEVAAFDVVMGLTSNANVMPGNACPSVGGKARQTQLSHNRDWLDAWIGPCNIFSGEGSFQYMRCF
jgi:hypothetical protein